MQWFDPITRVMQPYQRVDYTREAYLQQWAPDWYVRQIGARVDELQRR